MKLVIDRPHVEAVVAAFPDLSGLKDQLRFGSQVEVAYHQLPDDAIDGRVLQSGGSGAWAGGVPALSDLPGGGSERGGLSRPVGEG